MTVNDLQRNVNIKKNGIRKDNKKIKKSRRIIL